MRSSITRPALTTVFGLLRLGLLDASRPEVFQSIFGMIMIVLIALEFNHTILGLLERGRSIFKSARLC